MQPTARAIVIALRLMPDVRPLGGILMLLCKKARILVLLLGLALPAVDQAIAQGSSPWMRDKAGRQNQAKQWREEFARLDAQVPTLSPAEERWLKIEITDTITAANGKYTPRSLAAMDSREYQISVAKPHVQEIINACDQLVLLVPLGNERLETAQWTRLAALFLDKGFWQAVDNLKQRKIIQGNLNGLSQLYYENHVLWAQQILNGLVFRYLGTNSLQ